MYKTKIFYGSFKDISADEIFNDWVQNKDIEIITVQYQHTFGTHSIFILYKEV